MTAVVDASAVFAAALATTLAALSGVVGADGSEVYVTVE
jgi:hypothetical protein